MLYLVGCLLVLAARAYYAGANYVRLFSETRDYKRDGESFEKIAGYAITTVAMTLGSWLSVALYGAFLLGKRGTKSEVS